jgi:hypothetical protein
VACGNEGWEEGRAADLQHPVRGAEASNVRDVVWWVLLHNGLLGLGRRLVCCATVAAEQPSEQGRRACTFCWFNSPDQWALLPPVLRHGSDLTLASAARRSLGHSVHSAGAGAARATRPNGATCQPMAPRCTPLVMASTRRDGVRCAAQGPHDVAQHKMAAGR